MSGKLYFHVIYGRTKKEFNMPEEKTIKDLKNEITKRFDGVSWDFFKPVATYELQVASVGDVDNNGDWNQTSRLRSDDVEWSVIRKKEDDAFSLYEFFEVFQESFADGQYFNARNALAFTDATNSTMTKVIQDDKKPGTDKSNPIVLRILNKGTNPYRILAIVAISLGAALVLGLVAWILISSFGG